MKHFIQTAILAVCFTIFGSMAAQAAGFNCAAYGDARCDEHIEKIVTKKFIDKFPKDQYTIVVVYDFALYSDGGGVGFAVAGVAPLVTEKKYGNMDLMPVRRFTATKRVNGQSLSPYQRTAFEIESVQNAVRYMMDACNRSTNCDVFEK